MKRGIIMLAMVLSMLFSTTGYTTETKPEKSVVTKSVTVTTMQRPVRMALRDLNNKLNKVRPLRKLRNKLRSLLGTAEDATPVEQGVEK